MIRQTDKANTSSRQLVKSAKRTSGETEEGVHTNKPEWSPFYSTFEFHYKQTVALDNAGDGVVILCAGVSYLESHTIVGNICWGGGSDSELGTSPDRHFTSEKA